MSRLDEVEAEIADLDDSYSARTYTDGYADLARTLAAEVDARDEVITKLLAMLKPEKPRPKHEDFVPFDYDRWNDAVCAWDRNAALHARAVAIAEGREG